MATSLPLVNGETATFECTFGRGCEGICCQNGRPCTETEERQEIEDNLDKFLPHMRPEAVRLVRTQGIASNRVKKGGKMLRVVGGWCVFFNKGCVLHKVGATEGDSYKYKPYVCSVFPLHRSTGDKDYYVRQWGYEGEVWDLFCLNPQATTKKAVDTLTDEIGIVTRYLESTGEIAPEALATEPVETEPDRKPKKVSKSKGKAKKKAKVTSK